MQRVNRLHSYRMHTNVPLSKHLESCVMIFHELCCFSPPYSRDFINNHDGDQR